MTVLHRSSRVIVWDLVRAVSGGAVCIIILVLAQGPIVTTLALLGTAVFLWFASNTLLRGLSAIELLPQGLVERSPLRRREIAWSELRGLRLRFYATRRDGSRGWYSLKLTSDAARITIDSELDDFASVLQQARAAAEANDLVYDSTTAFNLQQFGGSTEPAPFRSAARSIGTGA